MNKDIMDTLKNMDFPKIKMPEIIPTAIPNYTQSMKSMFEPEYIDAQEVISNEEEQQNSPHFENCSCKICNDSLDDKYSWYYLRHIDDSRSFVLCSLSCLKTYYDKNPVEMMEYEIIDYTRCSAYYKCEELGNLRNRCQQHESLTKINFLNKTAINFCESAQAGVILSTHKMNEILKEFSERSQIQAKESNEVLKVSALQNKKQFEESTKMLKESGVESKNQFRITLVMTALTIILTVVNIAIAILTYKNNDAVNELKELNMKIEDINKNLSTLKP